MTIVTENKLTYNNIAFHVYTKPISRALQGIEPHPSRSTITSAFCFWWNMEGKAKPTLQQQIIAFYYVKQTTTISSPNVENYKTSAV